MSLALPKKMNSHFDIVTINAPVENNQQGGYSWWQLPTGIRSFQAETYEEFDESKQRFTDAMNSSNEPFDFIVGHSQGAIFLTSLLAQNMISHHPTGGYIMNGVAWPNPYTRQLESLKDTIFTSGRGPRVLLIIGEGDKINPPEQAMRVQLALEAAGYPVQTIHHPGGHSVPVKSSKTLELIMDWIQASMVQEQLKSLL
ncbi:hypothetical protein MPSEU_000895900 [Mayamaea pseudoterrestris]|nr:hypothetical protein MPSEU_000895900 [Mayamaea pseudoterrestris]